MHISSKIFITLAGLLHVVIFAMESVFFLNENVYSRFKIASLEHAQIIQAFAYNQGWYNLFLAVAALTGVFLGNHLKPNVASTLAWYACLSMLAAALVLILSSPALARAAFIQGLFPILAIISYFAFKGRSKKAAIND